MIDSKDFLTIARQMAGKSHCQSVKVGAVAVTEGRIVCSGINGTLQGLPNCDEVHGANDSTPEWRQKHHAWAAVYEVHAEANLVAMAAKIGVRLQGTTVYTTLSPCPDCCKLLAAAGVAKVVYADWYDKGNPESVVNATEYGMPVKQYKKGMA